MRAYRKELTPDDLYDLHPRDQTRSVVPHFLTAWDKELRRVDFVNRSENSRQASHTYFFVCLSVCYGGSWNVIDTALARRA